MSDIQGYEKYIIKKETLCTNPPINIYINRIDNRLALKKNDGYNYWWSYWWNYGWNLFLAQKSNRQNKEQRKCTEPWSG